MTLTLRERLLSQLVIDHGSGCLLWTGCTDNDGYGRIGVNGRERRVHQVAWELEYGPVPDGLVLDHVKARGCRWRHCGNTAHLEPVTPGENARRGTSPTAVNTTKQECTNGHAFDQANTYYRPSGKRNCRACSRAENARYIARKASAS